MSNFKIGSGSNLILHPVPDSLEKKEISKLVYSDTINSFVLSFFTIFLTLSFLNPIYLISSVSYFLAI